MKNFIALSLITLSFFASCKDSEKTPTIKDVNVEEHVVDTPNTNDLITDYTHKIVVLEELSSAGYVYLKVKENEKEYWMSIPRRPIEIGATYYYDDGMEMKDFNSKSLNRTFESVIFVEGIRDNVKGAPKVRKSHVQTGKPSVALIDKIPNGIRISELFEDPKAYANKKVIIKGEVVKVNNDVMQVNFVHLQDGTIGHGKYDLTITTKDDFKVGEVVTITGNVILNKDFGSGYVYDILVEKAVNVL
ncbi:nucleic acid binding, OB-fold, tRNA/helicase-typ e [Formosa agariphila KMM 3901]|uniref:Nucleic acid binding, OB-fold, tRNA/helicase-typ e n=1 Tax=Formosa agariphila (strain DSM 15362 / KCTC 12365 / LMG 23005 / KMM 3901 / M-2Alg 35-1) TaxID=1347342 RepID=T2KPQ1_FORAG|nr:hypothetical protein [Formosa agariphila]CDF79969.1 nucleic acid binding, OB-fold, tRNA/helicase-typ e [Formosa agariphila KMM 3901]